MSGLMEELEPLPNGFDLIDLQEILNIIDRLLDIGRAGTFDEAPGEQEITERAEGLLKRYKPAGEE